jgi:hypothetical protein
MGRRRLSGIVSPDHYPGNDHAGCRDNCGYAYLAPVLKSEERRQHERIDYAKVRLIVSITFAASEK